MKSTAGKVIVALCVLGMLGAFPIIYSLFPVGAGGQTVQELTPVGKFLIGSALGHERAGFSGRPMVQVFTRADAPDWPYIAACLQSAEVEAEMPFFVGVLVDERLEPDVEENFRARGLKVIISGLNGSFLGGLFLGFSCENFVGLLRSVRLSSARSPEKSSIYARLLETPEAIDAFILRGELDKAVRFVDLLKEFEGPTHPAVLAAEARLAQ